MTATGPVTLSATPGRTTSREVRQRLVEALRLDLVGPWPGHEQEHERLYFRDRPATFYLTGFLIPESARAPKQVAGSTKDPDREQALSLELGADGLDRPAHGDAVRRPERREAGRKQRLATAAAADDEMHER